MDKKEFKETEERVKRYYKKEDKIKSLNKNIEILEEQIKKIEKDIKECNFKIDPEQSSPSFGEKVQTSKNYTSYAEREIIRLTEIKLKRAEQKRAKIEEYKELIDIIEIDSNELEDVINGQLGEEYKEILEMKYKKGFGEHKIAAKVHLSQSEVNKKKKQAIEAIYNWLTWNNFGIKKE